MRFNALRVQQWVAILVACLGLYVVTGWAVGSESMVHILPASSAMALNTALMFIASALCLWPEPEPKPEQAEPPTDWLARSRTACAVFTILLSSAMLLEQGLGISLGIDWPDLHRWVDPNNPAPGRSAPNTCVGFMLTGLACLAIARNRREPARRRMADGLVLGTLLVGTTGILGYALNLESLYQIASYHRMAAPTAIGLTVLGLGLWLKLHVQCRALEELESPDLRIVRTAMVVLSIVVVCAGLGGFAVLKQGFEESMSAALYRTTINSAAAFQSTLDQRIGLGRTIADRPGLQKHLARLGTHPQDEEAKTLAREVGQSFLSSGVAGMRLYTVAGDQVVSVGDMVDGAAQVEVAVSGQGQKATMLWHNGFVLRTTNTIVRDGKTVGSVVAEQRLAEMTALLRSADEVSASTDILMCGRKKDEAVCFPSRFYQANLHIPMYKDGKPYLAISRALLGERGVLFVKDLRGLPVFAGYAPVGDSGLGLVFKTDSVDLFAPIRQRLNGFVGLLVLLIGAGTLLLRGQIQPLARKLVRAQRRTAKILESSHEAFIEMDGRGVIQDWNREAEQTFGWTRAEALGQDLAELIIPPELREAHRRGMAMFMQSGSGPVLGKRIELPAMHRSGVSLIVEITISAIQEEEEYRFTAFLHGIAERKQAEADLLAAKQQAESASRAKSDFLANMSHEIRTPMNAILGMLQLMNQTSLDQRQLDYLGKTEAAAKTLLGILNDILDFSKVEAGKMALDPHPFEVSKLLQNIGVILSANVGNKDVEVLFDMDPMLPEWIVGDALRLQQVLINLAGNALKFTEHGEVVVSVRVSPTDSDGAQQMVIAVRDSGIGIAADQLGGIFEGFSQAETSTTRRFGGTGLGLAISQRLVRLMGGELEVESHVGVGSTFRFTVPFEATAAPVAPVARGRLEGLRVLAVDDNASAREVMKGLLTSFGWHVDLAASGSEALGYLESCKFSSQKVDVVLVDWRMPDMDGWDTSVHIRSLYPTGHMPLIVMVTAYGRELLAQRQAELPEVLDGFLVKPLTASVLYDAVADARAGRNRLKLPGAVTLPERSRRLEGVRILLAEDNPINQQVACELLQGEGATVTIADNGLAAVAALTVPDGAVPFDVVLMDIQMPEMDGYTATREIRNGLGLGDLPIIAMTANAMATDRAAAVEAGMNDHVAKPFDLTQLVGVILHRTGRTAAPERPAVDATAPEALGSSPSVLQAEGALARLGGSSDLYRRALRIFIAEMTTMTVRIETLMSAPEIDTKALGFALHSLKGMASTVGAQALAAMVSQAELNSADGFAQPPGASHWAAQIQLAIGQASDAANRLADAL